MKFGKLTLEEFVQYRCEPCKADPVAEDGGGCAGCCDEEDRRAVLSMPNSAVIITPDLDNKVYPPPTPAPDFIKQGKGLHYFITRGDITLLSWVPEPGSWIQGSESWMQDTCQITLLLGGYFITRGGSLLTPWVNA